MKAPPLVQLVVPVYNEGENVSRLYQQLVAEDVKFDSLRFVYDLKSDTSIPYITQIAGQDSRVAGLKNELGRGVVKALSWAFSKSEPGVVIVVMGDLSDKLSIIPELVEHWRQGSTIVCPSRYIKGGKQIGGGFIKSTLSRTAGVSLKLLGFPTSDPTNNFKLYDSDWLREQKIESDGGFEIALELCYKAYAQGKTISEVPTIWLDRTEGRSNFRLFKWLPKYLKWYLRIVKELIF